MVQPWALALFKCAHHVQLWDKTRASAPVCIRQDYKADKMQSGGLVWRDKIKRGRKKETMQETENPSQRSQGIRAIQTNWWLHKQAVDCVIKHQCGKTQHWAAAGLMGSTAFIPSVFLYQELFDQRGRAAIFKSWPCDSCAPKRTSKFKWRRATSAPSPSPPFFPGLHAQDLFCSW